MAASNSKLDLVKRRDGKHMPSGATFGVPVESGSENNLIKQLKEDAPNFGGNIRDRENIQNNF